MLERLRRLLRRPKETLDPESCPNLEHCESRWRSEQEHQRLLQESAEKIDTASRVKEELTARLESIRQRRHLQERHE